MAKESFSGFVEQKLGKFLHFVIFAVLEWVLIIFLFIDGLLAFFANEFAKFFELQVPCLFCTRIDHVLVQRNPDFYYNNSICETHKKHVSSLAYCHHHKKLSDIRKMCEGCLLSFATEKESDCDTYKALVGILHKDLESFVEDDRQIHLSLPAAKKEDPVQIEKISIQHCSCCGVPLKVKSSYPKGKGTNTHSAAPAPSPRAPVVSFKNEESRNMELPPVPYTNLKFMSDNEPFPEDDDGSNAVNSDNQFKEDVKAATVPLLAEGEELNDDTSKTPRGSRFFGIPLIDSATSSPRWPTTRITRKSPLEKTEFASESVGWNLTIEADSDSILHRLKRQVRIDRKSLIALYMELDEERSASAVAANNAMAMITRLQAEKAAVQMEALQYQRMMEEQAEYDQEALQETNHLLAKRDEEIKAIEAELAAFREKYGCLKETDFKQRELDPDNNKDYKEYKSQSDSSYSEKSDCASSHVSFIEGENHGENAHNYDQAMSQQEENGGVTLSESLKDFEGEKTYLLEQFTKLEKINNFSLDNGVHSSQSSSDGGEHINGNERKSVLSRELSHLNQRVKALEADGGFLGDAAQTVKKNSEGEKLLTEISQNLQKLRRLVTMPFEESHA